MTNENGHILSGSTEVSSRNVVVFTSMRRNDVALTSIRRHFEALCSLSKVLFSTPCCSYTLVGSVSCFTRVIP